MFEQLCQSLVHKLLGASHVQALVKLDFTQQIVDVFGVVVIIGRIPFAKAAKVVIHDFLARCRNRNGQNHEAYGAS